MKQVLELDSILARKHFLKPESYSYIDLPLYFRFDTVLEKVDAKIGRQDLKLLCEAGSSPREFEGVNYTVLNNKNGLYDWRQLQLIHPVLYLLLVNVITQKGNWDSVIKELMCNKKLSNVECMSWPVVSEGKLSDAASLITVWKDEIEKKSIELALEFDYLHQTDITNFYGSVYTHSIPWALHTKKTAKAEQRNHSLVGNQIDSILRAMSYGQTNGIPQGSVLMDFIAEIVLSYVDVELSQRIKETGITQDMFRVLRFRDDYRIFTNNPVTAHQIIKLLSEVLIDLGMKLNASKTNSSNNVLLSSTKPDKLYWEENRELSRIKLIERIRFIHLFSMKFTNSGTLLVQLMKLDELLTKEVPDKETSKLIVSYIVDIAYHNPRVYPVCSSVISKLLLIFSTSETLDIVSKVLVKFKKIPNTGFLEIWIQRMLIKRGISLTYNERLCKIVDGDNLEIWNSDWLRLDIRKLINSTKLVDHEIIHKLDVEINPDEINIFAYD